MDCHLTILRLFALLVPKGTFRLVEKVLLAPNVLLINRIPVMENQQRLLRLLLILALMHQRASLVKVLALRSAAQNVNKGITQKGA